VVVPEEIYRSQTGRSRLDTTTVRHFPARLAGRSRNIHLLKVSKECMVVDQGRARDIADVDAGEVP
jgi:hypothetical protein